MKFAGIEALGIQDFVTKELQKSKGDMTYLFENHKAIVEKFGRPDISLSDWKLYVHNQRDRCKNLKISQEVRDKEIGGIVIHPELFKQDVRLKEANRERNTLYKLAASALSVEDSHSRMIENFKEIVKKSPLVLPPLRIETPKTKTCKNIHTALLLSDIHYGEVILPDAVHNLNSYSMGEANDRLVELFSKTVDFSRALGSESLNILSLGDLFSGIIHQDLVRTAEKAILIQMVDLAQVVAGILEGLVENKLYKSINMYCVVGNHGRTDMKPVNKNAHLENYEAMFFALLQQRFHNHPVVQIHIAPSTVMFADIGGVRFRMEHGDDYKGGGGNTGVPTGSIATALTKLDMSLYAASKDTEYDVAVMGHFHTPASFFTSTKRQVFVNGSVVGPNEYSLKRCHDATPPSQTVLAIDSANKEVLCSKNIALTVSVKS